MDNAGREGMDAAAMVLLNAVRIGFGSTYYKGGRFRSTLQVKQSIRKLMPYKTQSGWETQVGTKLIEALYWELGHQNLFTRKYERVQIWEPAGKESTGEMIAAYNRTIVRRMEAR